MKKILALVVAVLLIVASMSVAFAEGHTISVNSADTHTYDVYQILTGTLSTDGKTLSNVSWGSSVAATDGKVNGKTATEWSKTLEGLSGVDAVTAVDAVYTKGESTRIGQVDKDHPLNNLATGYYVMVDVTAPLENTDEDGNVISEDTKALNVIKLVSDVVVTKKWGTTENDKVISGDTLGHDAGEDGKYSTENTYNPGRDNDNVSIGDTVHYTLTAKVPEKADEFKPGTFFFVITDKLSAGLTFTNGSIKVYDGAGALLTENTNYSVQYGINENTFEIGIVNAASYTGQTLKVTYDAVLNENAVIGDEGNPNTSTVKYSNNPNQTYDGTPDDKEHPGFPDTTKNVPTGETPEQETITYTTGIEILKVDENGEVLTGATFEISGQSAKLVVTKSDAFVEAEDGNYWKLKNGTYTMTAPTEGNTMVPAEAGATKGYVVDADATGDGVITIDDTKYRPYVPATDAGKAIFVLDLGSKDAYDSTTKKYKKTATKVAQVSDPKAHKASMAVNDLGLARFDGLGAGTYTIKETVTPNGYNTVPDSTVTVTYNADGTAKFTVTGGTYEDGVIKLRVINKKGGTLPETGGMGTTILYIGGSILVLAAVILLVTKRRMNAED